MIKNFLSFYFNYKFYKNILSNNLLITYVGVPTYHNLGDRLLFLSISRLLWPISLVPILPDFFGNKRVDPFVDKIFQFVLKGPRTCVATILGGGTLLNNTHFFPHLKWYYEKTGKLFIFGPGLEDRNFFGDHLDSQIEILPFKTKCGKRPLCEKCTRRPRFRCCSYW